MGRCAAAVSWTSSFTNWALFWPLAESFVARVAIPSCTLCCQCNLGLCGLILHVQTRLTHIDWLCIARGWNIGAATWDDTISLQDVFPDLEQVRNENTLGSWICVAVFGVYVQAFYGFLSSWASKKFMSGWWVILRPSILWILALLFKFFLSRERDIGQFCLLSFHWPWFNFHQALIGLLGFFCALRCSTNLTLSRWELDKHVVAFTQGDWRLTKDASSQSWTGPDRLLWMFCFGWGWFKVHLERCLLSGAGTWI